MKDFSVTPACYRYDFTEPADYLHHRPPYLLVDRILSIQDQQVTTETIVAADTFYGQGHFPGSPVLPGALMQEMTTQSAGILIAARYNPMEKFNTHDPFYNQYALGVLVKVFQSRFRGFARPGDQLTTSVRLDEWTGNAFDFTGKIDLNGRSIMQNRFRLVNILSVVLQGQASA